MTQLLKTTIDDLRNGNITIFSKIRKAKTYKIGLRNVKSKKAVFNYAQHKDGSCILISKKIKAQYEQILCE